MSRLSVMCLARWSRSNVDHQLRSNRRSGESGAVATLVAIFFGTGVLLGLGALVIDTGSLLFERRQLQSGADAAAFAVAQDCLKSDMASTLCGAPDILLGSPLVTLTGANAADTKSDIASICGSAALVAVNGAFELCPTPGTPGLVDCPHTTSVGKYVEVRTSTRSGDGASTILPPILAQTLAGAGTQYSSTTVKACARAAWGKLALHPPVVPFSPSLCDYEKATPPLEPPLTVPPTLPYDPPINTPPWPSNPPYGESNPIGPAWEIALTINGANDAACAAKQGHNYPGGFGWLTHANSPDCSVPAIPADHWVGGDTGTGAANDCGDEIEDQVGNLVFLPIFNCMSNNKVICDNVAMGNNTKYHLYKMAAFYISAVDVTGQVKKGVPGAAAQEVCNTKGGKCIYGWFLQKTYEPGEAIEDIGGTLDPSVPSGVQLKG